MERDIVVQYVGQKFSVPKPVKVTQFVVTRKWKSRIPDLYLRLINRRVHFYMAPQHEVSDKTFRVTLTLKTLTLS